MLPRYKDIVDLLKKGSTMEAQEQIMSLREGALELQEENQELKKRVRELEDSLQTKENWSKEKGRYVLVNPWGGPAQVYALKKAGAESEAPHLLCTNCFHQSRKTILTPQGKEGWAYLICPSCKASIQTGYRKVGGAKYAEEYSEGDG
jgi:hypothetical protein